MIVARPPAPAAILLAALSALSSPSRAQSAQHSTSVPAAPLPWNQTVQLPAFDPSLGVLRDVRVTVTGAVHGTWGLENTGSSTIQDLSGDSIGAYVSVGLPAGWFPTLNPAMEGSTAWVFAPFDGTIDFAGPSGLTTAFGPAYGTGLPSYEAVNYQTLQAYVATAPGQTISISLGAVDASGSVSPPFAEQYALEASASIQLRYTYDLHPTWICRGVPWMGCPCGNAGSWGCGNSVNADGGRLDAAGQASLSSDSLLLLGSGMTNGFAVYFQGTTNAYDGILYGDGIRCVAGTIQRLGVKQNSGGASQYPDPGDAPVSVKGMIPGAGAVRYYQTMYRDPPDFCTSATVNVTSGVALTWGP